MSSNLKGVQVKFAFEEGDFCLMAVSGNKIGRPLPKSYLFTTLDVFSVGLHRIIFLSRDIQVISFLSSFITSSILLMLTSSHQMLV